jgi:hypothetical protein
MTSIPVTSFGKALIKTGMIGNAIVTALNISGLGGANKENQQTVKLPPPQTGAESYRLGSPSQYQFEGGKRLTTQPVAALNSAFTGINA